MCVFGRSVCSSQKCVLLAGVWLLLAGVCIFCRNVSCWQKFVLLAGVCYCRQECVVYWILSFVQ